MKKQILWLVVFVFLAVAARAEEFTIRQNPEFTYAYMEKRGSYTQIATAIQTFFAEFSKQGHKPEGALIALYYNAPGQVAESELLWRIGIPVGEKAKVAEPVKLDKLPACTVAYVLRNGPYDTVGKTYEALYKFIAQKGYKPAGPAIERYLNDPWTVKPEEIQTEILIPVSK